jgi:hypothetical protein
MNEGITRTGLSGNDSNPWYGHIYGVVRCGMV